MCKTNRSFGYILQYFRKSRWKHDRRDQSRIIVIIYDEWDNAEIISKRNVSFLYFEKRTMPLVQALLSVDLRFFQSPNVIAIKSFYHGRMQRSNKVKWRRCAFAKASAVVRRSGGNIEE